MRRPDHRLRLRPLRVVLAFAALLVAGALPAQAQEGAGGETQAPPEPKVSIAFSDGRVVRTVPFSTFASSVERQAITLPDGSSQTVDAIVLRELFERTGMGTDDFSTVTTPGEAGVDVAVTAPQVINRFGSQVVVYVGADGFLRLLRPPLDSGTDAAELARAGADGVLALTLQQGLRLVVTPTAVRENELVSFRATPPAGLDPATVRYEWDFNDDSGLRQTRRSAISHSYKEYGSYNPSVTLYVNGERYGTDGFAVQQVEVSEPPRATGRERRDANKANRRDDEDASGTSGDGTSGTGSGSGAGAGSGTGTGTGGTAGTTAPITPDTSQPQPQQQTPPPPRPDPPARRPPAPKPEPAGETVSGYLLASADVPLAAGGEQRATPRALASTRDDGSLEIPALVWVLAGLAGVVMLGWALESRTTLPYFKP